MSIPKKHDNIGETQKEMEKQTFYNSIICTIPMFKTQQKH